MYVMCVRDSMSGFNASDLQTCIFYIHICFCIFALNTSSHSFPYLFVLGLIICL
uniref:Uncharacterized protein n=1 Tax=Meloidogyne enterolobii TaxID=390850 RepID=A0A6V7THM9_MELEN|nr:unnamed protein product [Meloidogyne enterolobii]